MGARELAAQLVHEAGLVGVERRPREPQDQTGSVLGPILGERDQKLRDHGARVVVEPAEEAEVEQGEPPVLGQEDVAAVRVGVVDAFTRNLVDIRAEELSRKRLGSFLLETVPGAELLALDPLDDEDLLGHIGPHDSRHDQVLVAIDEPTDQLGVRSLLAKIELGA